MSVAWQAIDVLEGPATNTICACCGNTTAMLQGDLYAEEDWLGFYYIWLTPKCVERPPLFRLGTGDWSDEAPTEERWIFEVEYYSQTNSFMIGNVSERCLKVRATCLDRADIVGTAFASEAFAMIDAVFMKENRLESIRG